ncbi:MAG: O-antigen ligase family protein, partial [Lentisphaeraceae bacterium]|nr:O-antigen ligase family protein [Lentisphaeraceae bacterium]
MGKTEVSDIKTDKVAIVYLVLIAVSLFMAYPRVLLYPSGVTHDGHFLNWLSSSKVSLEYIAVPFLVRFPVELLVGALSLFYLASCNFSFRKTPRKLIMSIVLFVLALGGSVMVNGGLPENILGKLNYLLVPLAIALSVVRSGLFSKHRERVLLLAMTILWIVSITWSYWAGSPVGISGNRNWFVSVLLVTSPWAFFFFYHQFRKVLKRFFSHVNENWFASALSLLLTLPITLYWLIKCETRAAWLALIIYGLFVVIYPLSRKAKFLVSGLLLVLAMASFFVFRGTLEKAYNDDIRGPLWANTIRMIAKSPGVGWGPGQFQQKYSMFKSRKHSSRLVAALMTEHPHNEFLYLASEVGLPSALIWLSLLVLLILLKVRTREGHLCKFGVIILFVLSMF